MLKIDATLTNNIDVTIRRLKRSLEKHGVTTRVRENEFYQKPTTKRRASSMAARKRQLKKHYKENQLRLKAKQKQRF